MRCFTSSFIKQAECISAVSKPDYCCTGWTQFLLQTFVRYSNSYWAAQWGDTGILWSTVLLTKDSLRHDGPSCILGRDAAYMTVKWLHLSGPMFIVGASTPPPPSPVMRCGPYRFGSELQQEINSLTVSSSSFISTLQHQGDVHKVRTQNFGIWCDQDLQTILWV